MKSTALTVLCVLFLHVFLFRAQAQSLAEKHKSAMFDPAVLLQRQLEKQQLAHERDKNIVAMVTVYPDPKNMLLTAGYFVNAQGMFTEFQDGPVRGNDYGELHLPAVTFEALESLLLSLPAPKNPNLQTRRLIISFLSNDKWVTRIYDGHEDRDILQAILHVPSTNDSGYASILSGYKLP